MVSKIEKLMKNLGRIGIKTKDICDGSINQTLLHLRFQIFQHIIVTRNNKV